MLALGSLYLIIATNSIEIINWHSFVGVERYDIHGKWISSRRN